MEAWSTGPGNEEEVHLFDVEPGLYYITAYSFREARGFTIVADFVYPPENVDPDDAITLTPGEMVVEIDDDGIMYTHMLDASNPDKQVAAAQQTRRDLLSRIFV